MNIARINIVILVLVKYDVDCGNIVSAPLVYCGHLWAVKSCHRKGEGARFMDPHIRLELCNFEVPSFCWEENRRNDYILYRHCDALCMNPRSSLNERLLERFSAMRQITPTIFCNISHHGDHDADLSIHESILHECLINWATVARLQSKDSPRHFSYFSFTRLPEHDYVHVKYSKRLA